MHATHPAHLILLKPC